MNIYAGNLPYNVGDEELRSIFAKYGEVEDVSVITDRFSGKSKGFGFVVMTNEAEADAAIEALNDTKLKDRPLRVNRAKPRVQRDR